MSKQTFKSRIALPLQRFAIFLLLFVGCGPHKQLTAIKSDSTNDQGHAKVSIQSACEHGAGGQFRTINNIKSCVFNPEFKDNEKRTFDALHHIPNNALVIHLHGNRIDKDGNDVADPSFILTEKYITNSFANIAIQADIALLD